MKRLSVLIVAALVLLAAVSLASAQTGEWELAWFTIDGGGGTSSSGSGYAVAGTIGQPDAGTLLGGAYALQGGFWQPATRAGDHLLYLPVILR
ncbi:MAG: hypothetical protein ACK2U2_13790 [Anaerolineae bacterium]|jgi:hypothetical protein